MRFNSPWEDASQKTWPSLHENLQSEVVIVGAGISGVATLYALLMQTNKKVVLIDQSRVASGATGNNAGLAVAHIEKPVDELIKEFGLEKTRQAYQEMDSGWDSLLNLHAQIGLHDNLVPFQTASLGFTSVESFLDFIKANLLRQKLGHPKWDFFLLDNEQIKLQIPPEFTPYFQYSTQSQILSKLQTIDTSYMAVAVHIKPIQVGRMNSVCFCHRLLDYLTAQFPGRFSIYENTKINLIELGLDHHMLHHDSGKVQVKELILCTNGYKNFRLIDQLSQRNVTHLHQAIIPREGYLGAYLGNSRVPNANAFFRDDEAYADVPYWYLSQIPSTQHPQQSINFVGGPEFIFPVPYPEGFSEKNAETSLVLFKKFLKQTYNITPQFNHFWRGVMGYTQTGLRWVGSDMHYSNLWYNLGCNGIGIVPAISGAHRLAKLMNGEVLLPSLFDPPE